MNFAALSKISSSIFRSGKDSAVSNNDKAQIEVNTVDGLS